MRPLNYEILIISLAFALICVSAQTSAAACFGSPSTIVTEEVSYVPTSFTYSSDPRSNNGVVHLRGWLYYRVPSGGTLKDAPVVIFNHGHEAERDEPCEIARYFVNQKFVVFAPLRRGHYGPGIASTGIHVDDYSAECLATGNCPPCNPDNPITCIENAYAIDYLRSQWVDVRDAITYIRDRISVGRDTTGKLADRSRIAILGHSYGGALMVFANARLENHHNVAIDVSGAELSWRNSEQPYWRSELKPAASEAKRPMYFLQPKNGVSLAPTKVLFGESVDERFRVQASIFPPAPWDKECKPRRTSCWDYEEGEVLSQARQAHNTFIGVREQIELWGPSVIEFINRYPLGP